MKAVVIRYLNEIVSLTILMLMSAALIAGQADAVAEAAALEVAAKEVGAGTIRAELAIDLNLGELVRLNASHLSFRHTGE